MPSHKIAVLPGDGIGPEVIDETLKVLRCIEKACSISFEFEKALVGGAAYDQVGNPLPPATLALAKKADAVLLGAVGGPKWESLDYSLRPERALLGLRSELGLFANLRPATVFKPLANASTLKQEIVEGIDIMVVRELTGDLYFGKPRGISRTEKGEEVGINTMVYTSSEIERVARIAFEIAQDRRKRLTSVDKANVLETTELWRKIVTEVGKKYPHVELHHMYVDNCAMQLIRNPRQFDVILTTNMFGDILSDEASMLTGSIGMLPSASLGDTTQGMYEPIHGSAPDIAGQGVANPLATILSAGLMLRYSLNHPTAAERIEKAVRRVLEKGYRTPDIYTEGAKKVGASQMGDLVCEEMG